MFRFNDRHNIVTQVLKHFTTVDYVKHNYRKLCNGQCESAFCVTCSERTLISDEQNFQNRDAFSGTVNIHVKKDVWRKYNMFLTMTKNILSGKLKF
jgi:hypothetical protein